jgi:hypothetical protein
MQRKRYASLPRIRVVLFSSAFPIVAEDAIHSTGYLCLHKKSIEVHWTPVKLQSGPSMRCSAYWRIKSGSFNGCSADHHTVSIVCASDRSRMSPSFGHRLKKCGMLYIVSIYAMVVSNLHYQVAAAFGSNRALANLSTTLSIIPKLPFLPSRCRNYAIFISSSE